jgi:hypothetical protein
MATKLLPPPLDPNFLVSLAEKLILEAGDAPGAGHIKHKVVVDALTKAADAAMVWPPTPAGVVAEVLDGPAARLLLGAVVRHVYGRLKKAGADL